MISKLITSPTGVTRIELDADVGWHMFPGYANNFLKKIQAQNIVDISKLQSVDMHWYDFTWGENCYSLIFEEWPFQIVIECEKNQVALLDLDSLIKQL
jgi:hypothetical protein